MTKESSFYQDVKSRHERGQRPYIIAEIGSNHNGDIELAKTIIDSAAKCGADAAKFQSWTPSSLIAKEEYDANQSYDDSPKKHFGSLKEMCEKYYLRDEQHKVLSEYCRTQSITFCSSPFSEPEVDLLVELKVPFLKIASMDVNNFRLLRHAASTKLPIILSTGMASVAEIDEALNVIANENNDQVILLHCISIYPPRDEDIHLNNLAMLRQCFGLPVGLSDHSIGASIPLASAALGACLIEKHFTIDKNLEGWDHEISADPEEMSAIVRESQKVVSALGSAQRTVSEAEEEKKAKFRRSVVLKTDLPAGHRLRHSDFTFKRPGTGIPPNAEELVIGRELKRAMSADSVIRWNDLE